MADVEHKKPVDNIEIFSVSLTGSPAYIPKDEEERKKFQGAVWSMLKNTKPSSEKLLVDDIIACVTRNFVTSDDKGVCIEETTVNKNEAELLMKPSGSTGWDFAADDDPKKQYHHYRLADPILYSTCRVKDFGKGVKADICKRKDNPKVWEQQNYMFDKTKFTPAEAKEWLRNHKAKAKSAVLDQLSLDDLDVDLLYIEQREKWEKDLVDFQEKYNAGTFQPSWEMRSDTIRYYMSPIDWRVDREFTVRLLTRSRDDLGVEFSVVYDAVKKESRLANVTFSTSMFTEMTAKAWMDKHLKVNTEGEQSMTKEEITGIITEQVKAQVPPLLAPVMTAIETLKSEIKKFADSSAPPPAAGTPTPEPNTSAVPIDVNGEVAKSIKTQIEPLTTMLTNMAEQVATLTKGRTSPLAGQVPASPQATTLPAPQHFPVGKNSGFHGEVVFTNPNDPRSFEILVKSDRELPVVNRDAEVTDYIAELAAKKVRGGGQ